LEPGTINAQRGVFRSNWHVLTEYEPGLVLTLVNDSDVADFMFGTRRMIARPVWANIERDLRAPAERAIMQAVEAYWTK
jgi:hypothetical protein